MIDPSDFTALMDLMVEFREAVVTWARAVCDSLVELQECLDAAREASDDPGLTWRDMIGTPRAARAITDPAPVVWRWTWSPKYGRR